ncbi:hypothetical protein G3480_19845 [Thiorhodococcus mannitoliphagus]|uniref:Uncharacterized protein n=2 Tax=Thiorhodococcus mannitoliphagus TaxID=329406 RepID=A0A6P1DZR1_9GAMM|nr:hypothetical protein [Thiorhodococcus mannitoliphagus]
MVYASDVINKYGPKKHDYRTREEILEIFDSPASQEELKAMIDGYIQEREGVMVLITDYSNASYFITFKLE